MNASESVDFIRTAVTSFMATELYQACAFSGLSKEIRTNRLGDRLSVSSQAHLNKVVRQLNERPRKALGIETPAERFIANVASTG